MSDPDHREDLDARELAQALPKRVSTVEPGSLLGAILHRCAVEEGGVRALSRMLDLSPETVYRIIKGHAPAKHAARSISDFLGGRQRHLDEFTAGSVIAFIIVGFRFSAAVEAVILKSGLEDVDPELEKEASDVRASSLHGTGRTAGALKQAMKKSAREKKKKTTSMSEVGSGDRPKRLI